MVFWWKKESDPKEGVGVTLAGDPKAWPKSWHQLWLLQHKWRILKIEGFSEGSSIEFGNEYGRWRFHEPVVTPYIGVRVGQKDVTFYAFGLACDACKECSLHDVGFYGYKEQIQVPESPYSLFENADLPVLSQLELDGEITWV